MEGAFSDLVIPIVSPAEGMTLLLKSPVKERPALWTAGLPTPDLYSEDRTPQS